jgi:hypothetical protein
MQRTAHITSSGAPQEATHESNHSKADAKGKYALPVSGAALKSTPELLRFVDFLARYEARRTVAATD